MLKHVINKIFRNNLNVLEELYDYTYTNTSNLKFKDGNYDFYTNNGESIYESELMVLVCSVYRIHNFHHSSLSGQIIES